MPWLVQRGLEGAAVVHFEMAPPCREITPPYEYYQDRGIRHGRLYNHDVDIEDRFWPRRARLKTKRKSLPHLVGFCSFHGVSDTFRRCVEELESGVHEFRRVEVEFFDGSPFPEEYYALNIRSVVQNVIDWERTTASSKMYGAERRLIPLSATAAQGVVMRRETIAGKHLWMTDEIGYGYSMSDEMYHLMEESGVLAYARALHLGVS